MITCVDVDVVLRFYAGNIEPQLLEHAINSNMCGVCFSM